MHQAFDVSGILYKAEIIAPTEQYPYESVGAFFEGLSDEERSQLEYFSETLKNGYNSSSHNLLPAHMGLKKHVRWPVFIDEA
jgi:hypothetical protein